MANAMYFDAQILSSAKAQYDNYAGQITTLMGQINTLVTSTLPEGWKGDSYDAFAAQNEVDVQPAFAKMNEALSTIAGQINTALQNAIAADQASKVK